MAFFLNLCGDVKYALLNANCARVGNHKTIKESFHCFAEKKTLTISIVTFLMICAFEYCSIMSSPNDSSLIVQSNSPVYNERFNMHSECLHWTSY